MTPGVQTASRDDRRMAWLVAAAVVGAFLLLGAVWGFALKAAAGVDTHRLSKDEEKVLLEKRAQEARLKP